MAIINNAEGFGTMATMMYSDMPKNAGELLVFNALEGGPDDWIVFYSAKVPQMNSPRPREIDFVVVIGTSVICLEVKGGVLLPAGDKWVNGDGESVDDPIAQARSAMFALKNYVVPKMSELLPEHYRDFVTNGQRLRIIEHDLKFEHALWVTHPSMVGEITTPKLGKGGDGWLLLDARDLNQKEQMYGKLRDLAGNNLSNSEKDLLYRNPDYAARVDDVRDLLQKCLSVPGRSDTLVRVNKDKQIYVNDQLIRLTDQQQRGCMVPRRNARVMIDGAAGTGKTILALQLARQRANEKNERVLLVCNTDNMAVWLRGQSLPAAVVVTSTFSLVITMFAEFFGIESSTYRRFCRGNNRVLEMYPEHRISIGDSDGGDSHIWAGGQSEALLSVVRDAVAEFAEAGGEPPFNYLIVDEAQIMVEDIDLEVLNSLLRGGLLAGKWTMFGDFANQNIMFGPSGGRDLGKQLKHRYPGILWSNDQLTVNCRNTRQILDTFAGLAEFGSYDRNGEEVEGPPVSILYVADNDDTEAKLDQLVRELREKGIRAKDVVLLGGEPYSIWSAAVSKRGYGGWPLHDISDDYGARSNSRLNYCWYPKFQGLESSIVIVMFGLGQSDIAETHRRVLYTNFSRAKTQLIIFTDENTKPQLEALLDGC